MADWTGVPNYTGYPISGGYAGVPGQGGQGGNLYHPPATPAPPSSQIPPTPGFTPPPANNPPATGDSPATGNALDLIKSEYPWLSDLGLVNQIHDWAVQGLNGDSVVAEIRKTPQWAARFPGIKDETGAMIANEGQYLQTETDYKTVLGQFNPGYDYNKPSDFVSFFKQRIDPNELKDRLTTYDQVKRSSDDVKTAFYVYAGVKLTDDELYMAAVDPSVRDEVQAKYDAGVATGSPDYQTWLQRTTQAALDRTSEQLTDLEKRGVLPAGAASSALYNTHPDQARNLIDSLYRGGPEAQPMALNDLMHSFQYAMIGSAASGQGLQLPDQSRLEELRQAGVDRAKALDVYGQIAQKGTLMNSALSRAGLGRFSQGDFEKALFLSAPQQNDLLTRAQASEKALGEGTGAASLGFDNSGRLQQRGLQQAFS